MGTRCTCRRSSSAARRSTPARTSTPPVSSCTSCSRAGGLRWRHCDHHAQGAEHGAPEAFGHFGCGSPSDRRCGVPGDGETVAAAVWQCGRFAEALRHGLAVEPVKPTQRPIAAGRPRPSLAWTPPSRKAYIIAGAVVAVMAAAGGTAMYLRSTAQSGRAAKPDIQATAPSPDAGSARTSADAAATGGQGNPAGATDNAASASLGPGHGVDRVQPADLPVQSFPSPPPVAATNAPPVAPTRALPGLADDRVAGNAHSVSRSGCGLVDSGRGARAAEDDHPGWPVRRVRAAIERVASPTATGPAAARRNAGVASRADKEGPAACAREPGSL